MACSRMYQPAVYLKGPQKSWNKAFNWSSSAMQAAVLLKIRGCFSVASLFAGVVLHSHFLLQLNVKEGPAALSFK